MFRMIEGECVRGFWFKNGRRDSLAKWMVAVGMIGRVGCAVPVTMKSFLHEKIVSLQIKEGKSGKSVTVNDLGKRRLLET
jgi:hypothetical protein